jgi:hypothetical protein
VRSLVGAVVLSLSVFGFAAAQSPKGPKIGSKAPEMVLEDSTGKIYRLSELRGQPVVVEFFRSGGW